MNRRTAIKNVIILGAGATWLASCQDKKASITLKNIPLSASQEELLATLTETIIPTTPDFIGAKELESHKFLLMMTDDCSAPDEQKKFMDGMTQFEEACNKKFGNSFVKCSPSQREEFLLAVEAKEGYAEEVLSFYQTVKRFTIQSFTSSKEYLTKVRHFSLIPGPFKGCVTVENV